jgi:HD-GYP domain-containing protein (c-di-GMP phosphodiesterase class II)
MTSDRPYRKALSTGQACEILRSGRGRQWDAVIVEAFLSYLAKQAEGVEALAASLPAALEKSA